jgi:S-adenosyl-L-methionine hydrolase (adenosine-forming)
VTRTIVFCSDYGLEDEFVGVCHSVIARIAPEARIIDLAHGLSRHDLTAASVLLVRSIPFMPPDSVLLGVVDPGVGSKRRALAVESASGAFLVGPDNGLFGPALVVLGGASRAVQIASPEYLLSPVSTTFHGRDVFAPAAAHLANGLKLEELGPPIDPSTLEALDLPRPEIRADSLLCSVLGVDRFGNIQLNVGEGDLAAAGLSDAPKLRLETPREHRAIERARTFSDVPAGEIAAVIDSSGFLALIVNRGSASDLLELEPGDTLVIGKDG